MTRRAGPACLPLVVLLALAGPARSDPREPSADPRGLTVRITEPAADDFIFGKVRVAAEVQAPPEMRDVRVEFLVGGRLIYIDREAPYEVYHDFGDEPRSWVIEAVAVSPEAREARATVVTRKLTINYRELVDRVVVTASVVDDDRRFVPDLTRDDFVLAEDDVVQTIVDFAIETRPITMAILLDTSGSMREELSTVQEAAKAFVGTLRPQDRAMVIDFDENVYLLQNLTSDHQPLRLAIEGTDAEGGTAFYDAIFAAYRRLRGIDGRKAVVLLTDGADTNSRFSYQKVLEMTRTHDVVIYSIGLGATVLDIGIRGSLKQLADETGGRSYFPRTAHDLEDVYQQIAEDLRSQYYIAYSPGNKATDGTWRKIKLETRARGVKVKTRRGYYAVKP
ncbi:MAG TPA: VWA domain-containing protein [Candidatus Polarisedimenticolia bacterium]|nr:VWA domain-containing protein [Candidatus Polarisedimenticolia bacterium]